jgi:type II secretory pathway predicted ATPase ExeA
LRNNAKAWEMPVGPIRLKTRLQESSKTQAELAKKIIGKKGRPICKGLLNAVINKGYIPPDVPEFKEQVEKALEEMGVAATGIWDPLDHAGRGWYRHPKKRTGRAKGSDASAPDKGGDDLRFNYMREFLEDEEIRHFGLEEDPFYEIDDFEDIYMSPQLKLVERRFHDTVKRHGIMAIVGDIGAGKSTLLRHILVKLLKDKKVVAIMPDDMDREKLTGRGLTAAIVSALSGSSHHPRSAVERDRLAKKLLQDAIKNGVNPVLIIDEAHDLSYPVIIALKRIWDSGLIFKLISIVIVGQGGTDAKSGHSWGLKETLETNDLIKEFAERCYMVDIGVMNGSMGDYLAYRFKKAGGDARKIFTPEALSALSRKAEVPNRAHNIAVRAMRAAYRDGKTVVGKEHVGDA